MISDEQFVTEIRRALTRMSVSELADEMSVGQGTIKRWLARRNSPHQAIKVAAMNFLKGRRQSAELLSLRLIKVLHV